MKRLFTALIFLLGIAAAAMAGQNPNVGLALHVQSWGAGCANPMIRSSSQFVTSWSGLTAPLDFYVYVSDFDLWWMGTEYGLTWPSDWTFVSWTSCATWSAGEIQNPGDSVIQNWDMCVVANPFPAGILTLIPTSPGQVSVIPNSVTGRAGVVDCADPPGFDAVLPCPAGNGRAGWVDMGPCGCNPTRGPGPIFRPPCYTCNNAVVVCEPQPANHPPTYWYDADPTARGGFCDFHVRVFDTNPAHYTSPVVPPYWTFSVHQVGSQWWASWWDTTPCQHAVFDTFRFQFNNPTHSAWGDWTATWSRSNQPYSAIFDASWHHAAEADGHGYRVHVPTGVTDEDEDSD
jgi:hypothetical protein